MQKVRFQVQLILLSLCVAMISGCQATSAETQQQQIIYEQAQQWYQQGDLLTAEQQLNQLHRRRLASLQSWRLLGNIHFRQQRLQAAELAYQEALQFDRNDGISWHNLALVQLRKTTATLMQARAELGTLEPDDARLLDRLLRLQRVALH